MLNGHHSLKLENFLHILFLKVFQVFGVEHQWTPACSGHNVPGDAGGGSWRSFNVTLRCQVLASKYLKAHRLALVGLLVFCTC